MKPSESEQDFIRDIRQTLDQAPLDAATTQQLDQLRRAALQPTPRRHWMRFAMPVAAFASISVLALALLLLQNQRQHSSPGVDSVDAFEIISSSDALEMYQNLEFYLWLDEQETSDLG